MVKSKQPGSSTAHKVDTYMAQATTHSFNVKQQWRREQREKKEDMRQHEENNKAYSFAMTIVIAVVIYISISQMVHKREHDAELKRIKLENEKKSSGQ